MGSLEKHAAEVVSQTLLPVHVEEDVSCGLSALSNIFFLDVKDQRIVAGLPTPVRHRVHITDVVSCNTEHITKTLSCNTNTLLM